MRPLEQIQRDLVKVAADETRLARKRETLERELRELREAVNLAVAA